MPKKIIYILLSIFSLVILVHLSFKGWTNYLEVKRKQLEFEKRKAAWRILEETVIKELHEFKGEAGVLIKDLSTGWQIGINQKRLFPSASLVKIPILACSFYAVNENKMRWDETLRLKVEDKVSGLGPLKNLPSGTEFNIEKLLQLMIIESDNTATNMLINRLGFDYLNDCFKRLGLKDTNISRKMLDFKSRRGGIENYTTAQDSGLLLEKIYNQTLIDKNISSKCLELLKRQKIRDRIPKKLPQDTMIAHKTGLEKSVCHDAGIVYTKSGDFLICVLTKYVNKNSKKAKEFIAQIAYFVYNYYQTL